jgi:hypothetical protein
MPSTESSTQQLAASFQRAILGSLLAIIALFTLSWGANALSHGNGLGLLGLLVGFGAAYWIFDLFRQGVREA